VQGLTVAVTATGLDRVYPAAHQSLAREIAQTGAIVSEFPIGTSPKPAYFPRRNRVISGLCYGTLVVEAALKSGTLTTAAHATEQSREVFAIPGNIDNPQSRGCHALLRNGATLVESIDDILIQLAPLLPTSLPASVNSEKVSATYNGHSSVSAKGKQQPAHLSTDTQKILDAFDYTPLSLDAIVDATGFDIITVTNLALDLELDGEIAIVAGGKYIKTK